MAEIVAVTRFIEPGSSIFSSYINYIDRESAVRKENVEKFNIFSEYMDYMDDEQKTITDKEKRIEKVSALFTKDRDMLSAKEKQELKDIFCEARENGSNMWQTVVSFENSYLERLGIYDGKTNLLNESVIRKAGRRAISEMLRNEGMENAIWTASFHYNTDNIHIHVATVERIPIREKRVYTRYTVTPEGKRVPVIREDGEPVTYEAYKGTFKKKSIEILKSVMRSELENNKEVYSEITGLIRNTILQDKKSRNLLDTPGFKSKMKKLYTNLNESGIRPNNWNYNQNQIKDIRPQIDDLSMMFIEAYHQDDFMDLMAKIENEALRQQRFYGKSSKDYKQNILYGKEGLYSRLGIDILKEIKIYDRVLMNEKEKVKRLEQMLAVDPNEAVKSMKELSMRGNAFAQNRLGMMYLKGEYVYRNVDTAKGYFARSADNGNSFGKMMYEKLSMGDHVTEIKYSDPLQGSASRLARRGLKRLEYDLKRSYESFRNQREAEELQYEIQHRGEEL